MRDYIKKYVSKALSLENRKVFDGDSNARYRVKIEMAEVGGDGKGEEGNFWFSLKIPRQVDNELGMTAEETVYTKQEAVAILKEVIAELEK